MTDSGDSGASERVFDPAEALSADPGAIGPFLALLSDLAGQGVTHVHGFDSRGLVELVSGVREERTRWNDGSNVSVTLKFERIGR